jgi:SAM-dependent methyltransferase
VQERTQPIDNSSDQMALRTVDVPICEVCGCAGEILYSGLTDHTDVAPGVYNFRRCQNLDCGTLWLDPRPIDEDIHLAYRNYYTHSDSAPVSPARRSTAVRKAHSLATRLLGMKGSRRSFSQLGLDKLTPGRVLDIGCGNGSRLKALRDIGWQVQGQDVDEVSANFAMTHYGIPVFVGDLASADFQDDYFDAIISNHVFEHVYHPVELLREAFRILKPGGLMRFVMPNARAFLRKRFGQDWVGLDPPRHLHLFTTDSVRLVARQAGIEAPFAWTTSVNARPFASSSDDVARDHGRALAPANGVARDIWIYANEARALTAHRFDPDSGEECVLDVRKPISATRQGAN